MALNSPSKCSRCSSSNLSRALPRSSSLSAMIMACILAWCSVPRKMCSLRQSPMPSAPNSRALPASSGVSAFARTPRVRRSSAQASTCSKLSLTSGSSSGTSSAVTRPLLPSMAIVSPSDSVVPPALSVLALRSIASSPAPATHGLPMPRATRAA